jgi:hypothetical protein
VAILDRAGIAARLRALLVGQDSGELGDTAARLGVEELSLRMSIDELSPHPTVDVMTAVIHHYGVDPTWLLTGNYNPATHRAAIEGLSSISTEMRAAMERRPGPLAEPPLEPFRPAELN